NIEEIMIDEYQDVNCAQDTILKAISRGDNRFMVGDIKQSIYRFRQAMPQLFIDMLLSFNSEESGEFPKKILLNGNFRTEKRLTNTINTIFENIMSAELGDIAYNEEQALIPYATYPPTEIPSFEAILIENDTEDINSLSLEAKIIAQRIKELISSGECIISGGISRPIQPCDIAILLRSPKNKAVIFKKALAQLEVNAESAQADDFLTSYEIQSCFNLLSAIENPTASIALSGAMLSPIFGFTDDLLTELAVKYPAPSTYASLCKAQEDESLKEFKEFKTYFDSLHEFSASHDVPSLIWKILNDTDFYLVALSEENGVQKRANLNLLLEYAYEYKRRGYISLSSFVRIFSRLYEKSERLESPKGSDKNAVTITSIHRSKGLEWPVVFISDSAKSFGFYQNDMKETYVLNDELGFASVRRE
ncbi:MAG: 3'-5' exonuclease, partial [Oscillospiraceae bacterium]